MPEPDGTSPPSREQALRNSSRDRFEDGGRPEARADIGAFHGDQIEVELTAGVRDGTFETRGRARSINAILFLTLVFLSLDALVALENFTIGVIFGVAILSAGVAAGVVEVKRPRR